MAQIFHSLLPFLVRQAVGLPLAIPFSAPAPAPALVTWLPNLVYG